MLWKASIFKKSDGRRRRQNGQRQRFEVLEKLPAQICISHKSPKIDSIYQMAQLRTQSKTFFSDDGFVFSDLNSVHHLLARTSQHQKFSVHNN